MEINYYTKGSKITLNETERIKIYSIDRSIHFTKLLLLGVSLLMLLISLY